MPTVNIAELRWFGSTWRRLQSAFARSRLTCSAQSDSVSPDGYGKQGLCMVLYRHLRLPRNVRPTQSASDSFGGREKTVRALVAYSSPGLLADRVIVPDSGESIHSAVRGMPVALVALLL